jgi:hypothetical protein
MRRDGGPVDEGAEGREPGTSTREGRSELPDGGLDGGEAGLGEGVALDMVRNRLRTLELDRLWHQKVVFVCSVGGAESHDGGEHPPDFPLEVFSDVLEDPGMMGWSLMGRNWWRKG